MDIHEESEDVFYDEEGFKGLLEARFCVIRGLVLLECNLTKSEGREIDRLLETTAPEDVQRLNNHRDLLFYGGVDISRQREYRNELKESWEKRLPLEFPDTPTYVEIKDDGVSVVVTVLNESFRSE